MQPAPVSAVISTRVKPGKEPEYRAWERKIAAAQSKAPGLQGYRFEPPMPGVQEDFVAILRFDSEANLQAWLDFAGAQASCSRRPSRSPRSSTPGWRAPASSSGSATAGGRRRAPAVWKMDMIVLLLLYPIVFLFGVFVQTPLLFGRVGLPFAIALFIGNVVSVLSLNYLVPWTSIRFSWWLAPSQANRTKLNIAGAVLVSAIYLVPIWTFWRLLLSGRSPPEAGRTAVEIRWLSVWAPSARGPRASRAPPGAPSRGA